ncbi:hypothetical protein ACFQH5_15660 [Halomonas salifodinae]|uniref:Uncharacterized protein n=1 Tax=Halomonas salifodinae TaxID=438745 RepID=A0ABW2F290_9GAMM
MTIFTDGPIVRRSRNLLDEVTTGQFGAARAAAQEGWIRSPTSSGRRNAEIVEQERGKFERPGFPAYGVPEVRSEPETPMLSAEQARQRVQDAGLPLTVPEEGIREGVLDILMERKQEELQRQFVLDNAPASTVPLQLLASFAASSIDPINIGAAFVPVYGQARYASMLASATSRLGRAGVRARVGAVQGAVGTALVEPIVLSAASREQADYGLVDSLSNIAFGAVLGGGLHTLGGAISDFRARRLATPEDPDASTPPGAEGATRPDTQEVSYTRLAFADDPAPGISAAIRRQIELDAPARRQQAARQAQEELLPTLRGELEEIAQGRLPNVRDLRNEQQQIALELEGLDQTFRARAKAFQREEGLSRKQAESAARRQIVAERERLQERNLEISERLDVNLQAELARADIGRIRRGDVPERFISRVDERAEQIASGFEFTKTARAVAEASPWPIRQAALRSAVAQAATGRRVDVEPIFALNDPATRQASLRQLKAKVEDSSPAGQGRLDEDGLAASRHADEASQSSDGTDLESARAMLDEELAITEEMARQAGFDLSAALREADELTADAETFAAAFRAAAICRTRN